MKCRSSEDRNSVPLLMVGGGLIVSKTQGKRQETDSTAHLGINMIQIDDYAFIGRTITHAIDSCIAKAREAGDLCQFEFNGVNIIVAGDSDSWLIYRDWQRGMSRYVGDNPTVGPYPKVALSAEELASDTAIQAERDRVYAIQQEEYAKAAKAQKERALSLAGPIELIDEEGWKKFVANNQDGYGGRVVRYAEEWARLMQTRLANGETIPECADELGRMADDDGITGFMYGCAVGVLAKVWKHGESLRRWHNKETQIGTEGDKANETGGVLNPAMLTVG